MPYFCEGALSEKLKIVVAGDGLLDLYLPGRLEGCQDDCPKFVPTDGAVARPGGAWNAARCLDHAGCRVAYEPVVFEEKRRYTVNGRCAWRADRRKAVDAKTLAAVRGRVLESLEGADGVYLADYAKGLFTDELIREIIKRCLSQNIPIVVDPKRSPGCCRGAIIKCNHEYAAKYAKELVSHVGGLVITRGEKTPIISLDPPG